MPRREYIRVRRGTAAQWSAADPVLALGEPGFETDTNTFKLGDGVTAWTGLTGISGGGGGGGGGTAAWAPRSAVGEWITPLGNHSNNASFEVSGGVTLSPYYANEAISVDQFALNIQTGGGSGSVIRVGIFQDNGIASAMTLVVDCGTIVATGTGFITSAAFTSTPLSVGRYWIAAVWQVGSNPSPLVRGVAGSTCDMTSSSAAAALFGGGRRWAGGGDAVTGAFPGTLPAPSSLISGAGGLPNFAPLVVLHRSA